MKTRLAALVSAAVLGLSSDPGAATSSGSLPAADLPAFPGAIGFGAATPGGRGGRVLVVDSLADRGPGTLRWALEEVRGPRIVVFAVGGVLDLSRQIEVGGRVTVAGQTAPGGGVVVRGARLQVVGDDVVIRGLKLRPGGGPGQALRVRDAISVGAEDRTVRRVVIDGNSLAWAPDENAATWYDVSDVSFTNNIIAEGLEVPPGQEAEDGLASMGLLVGDGARRVTIARNLFVGNAHRNPQVKSAVEIEVINNVVHDYGPNGTEVPRGLEGPVSLHVLGNHYVEGAGTVEREPIRLMAAGPHHLYHVRDNLRTDRRGRTTSKGLVAGGGATAPEAPVFEPSGSEVLPAGAVRWRVPARAGARGRGLDAVDAAIVDAALEGRPRGRDRPPAGAFDVPIVEASRKDGDGDGIPDGIERLLGTDPGRDDAGEDLDGDGYTNVEEYINGQLGGGPAEAASCPAEPAAADAEAWVIEAEAMELTEGFTTLDNPHASGGTLIQADGDGPSRARHELDVPPMRYDLTVRYFDEDDGVSVLGVRLGGRLVALWEWDEDRGTSIVDTQSMASHSIPCLEVEPGAVLEVFGSADEGEPLRVDAVVLTPAGGATTSN